MIRRRWHHACLAALVSILVGFPASLAGDSPPEWLMTRLARTASLYEDATLRFACRETITWKDRDLGFGRQAFAYVFIDDRESGYRNYRTWIGADPEIAVRREVYPAEYRVPIYLDNAFLWYLTFGRSRRMLHTYVLEGTDEAAGVQALRIRFEGLPPIRRNRNDWCGYAWVDPESGQIVRVEAWPHEDWRRRRKLREAAEAARRGEEPALEIEEITRFETEFGTVEHGLRFPSVVRVSQSRFVPRGRKGRVVARWVSEVEQVYDEYRFFGVKTEEEIRRLLELGAGD